ncbi:MAG: replicative DNA helicase [Rhodospirillaceae bacterium]|nr:MAG: replicative DNA helicase [Rhodospirillaceae bacterium]
MASAEIVPYPTTGTELPDHLRPYETEQALLGAIMANNENIKHVSGWLKPEYFGDALHGRLFEVMLALSRDGKRINPLTLLPYFEQDKALTTAETTNPRKYLVDLSMSVVSTLNPEDFARHIVECYGRRKVIEEAQILRDRAVNDRFRVDGGRFELTGEQAALQLMADGRGRLQEIEEVMTGGQPREGMADIAQRVLQVVEAAYLAQAPIGGITTGLRDLDKHIGGLFPQEMMILAGRPSMGKTALATTMAWRIAYAGIPVVFFSLEMSKDQIVNRMLSMETGISTDRIRRGDITSHDYDDLVLAAQRIAQLPLHIDDDPRLTPALMEARARVLLKSGRPGLLVVDYLQLMRSDVSAPGGNKTQEIGDISRDTKAAIKNLGVPGIVLSQLSRGVEAREDKRPQLQDLRESGAIEQDGDQVLMLFREEYYLERQGDIQRRANESQDAFDKRLADHYAALERCRGTVEILIQKQRFGPIGMVKAAFVGEAQRFDDLQKGA